MSELLPCPWCGSEPRYQKLTYHQSWDDAGENYGYIKDLPAEEIECSNVHCNGRFRFHRCNTNDAVELWNTRHSKYPLAPVSSTLDQLLAGFDGAAEGELDLGEIEHKGQKVMVKIKVVRGE